MVKYIIYIFHYTSNQLAYPFTTNMLAMKTRKRMKWKIKDKRRGVKVETKGDSRLG